MIDGSRKEARSYRQEAYVDPFLRLVSSMIVMVLCGLWSMVVFYGGGCVVVLAVCWKI